LKRRSQWGFPKAHSMPEKYLHIKQQDGYWYEQFSLFDVALRNISIGLAQNLIQD
jgi:hypothetical protein